MGHTYINAKIINPKTGEQKELEFLVDSGSFEIVIAPETAEELKLVCLGDEKVELANGNIINAKEWSCLLEYDGKKKGQPVMSFEGVTEPLLGVFFLESFNLELNSKEQIVKKSKPLKAK